MRPPIKNGLQRLREAMTTAELKNNTDSVQNFNALKRPTDAPLTLLAPDFHVLHEDVVSNRHTYYFLKGGRGSTKSSFVSIEIILGVMSDPLANAVVLRKVGRYLKDSVYTQLLWAIDALDAADDWEERLSPLELIYKPTKQRIVFRGADEPRKIKSTKFKRGYCKYLWYEETDEFGGIEELRTINQSLIRGGDKFTVFYSYNPPRSQRNWVNSEVMEKSPDRNVPDRLVHHSDYRNVPREWLGEQFFIDAEHIKSARPEAYAHEYLGEVTGTGGEIFTNVKGDEITDAQIARFDNIRCGIDYGYAVDPFVYVAAHYDKTRRCIYVFREIYKVSLSNRAAVNLIKKHNKSNQPITADSAEPKSIAEMRALGLRITGARKGPDSVEYGIKWMQDLEGIIIDPVRCPNTYREFYGYELEPDNSGGFKAKYPDKNNHTIDALRYACEGDMRRKGGVLNVRGI